jgi:ABC-2 type transport system ATP-binding protein
VGYEKTLTRNLSGAWRQRLALACAIVHKPPMLFLDEATAGVDPISRREFWDLIYDMAGEGVSVLATTHYMDEADYCNAIGMMHRGKLIKVASPDTFKDQYPGHLVMIECDDPLRAEKVLDAHEGVLDSSVHGVQVHATLKSTRWLRGIQQALKKENVEVTRIEDIQPSLEDVFIEMIEEQRDLYEQV